ncbi:MAG TPA: hypothetical protein VHT73_03310 [Thermodesulfobacteriota bacterium]|nr:hypothetical protein [Thermodesulfobacteriota bacterium]
MNALQAELLMPKEGDELRLSEDNAVQVTGFIKNPMPGKATIVFLLIQPNRCPIMRSVNVDIKEELETKKGEDNIFPFSIKKKEDAFIRKITIQVMREYNDGTLSCDAFTIKG